MSYCHECGEQVAKEDVFCPFCGITLKPVGAVNDSSISKNIVDTPPPIINQETLDVFAPKNKPQPPIIEKPKESLPISADKTELSENVAKPVGFASGKTSENWNMRTESVEIPSDFLDESQGVPLPIPEYYEAAQSPIAEVAPIEIEEAEAPKAEDLPPYAPIEEINESVDPEISQKAPAIIQAQDLSLKIDEPIIAPQPEIIENKPEVAEIEDTNSIESRENNVNSNIFDKPESSTIESQIEPIESKINISKPEAIQPVISAPIAEKIGSSESVIESAIIESDLKDVSVESQITIEDNVFDKPPIQRNVDLESLNADISHPISSEPENILVKEPRSAESDLPHETKLEPIEITPLEVISFEPENKAVIENHPSPEISEPPIMMPDLPILLDNQDVQKSLDPVQPIQNEAVPESQGLPIKAKSVDLPMVEESPVLDQKEVSQENRPFTTPNIGNADTDGRKSAKLKPLEEGVVLNGRYEVVRKIGGGGMGAVYLASDRNLGGVLRAVKEMVQSYIESDQQDKAISDFKRESMLLTSLDHPAIPTIYDYFYDEKEARFYLVMKYISGGDLSGRLRAAPEGRIDEKSITEWAIQITDVLEYLHNHEPSIVYRDLKPANVMIDGNSGRVMLIDFGIARWVNKEEKGVTAVGTMGYAPPELFSGNVEPRSDIYSLGSTMFHLLTGADPQSNPLLIFDFQKNPRPRQINSQLSDQIERILMRSVEYNAEMRFASAAQMRDELKEHLNNLQSGKVTYGVKSAPSSPAFSEQSVFCGFCGRQIVATDVFCAFCGAQQPIAQQGFSQPSIAVQPLIAKLVIVGTDEPEPSSYKLEKTENLLGRRDPMSNIFPEVDLSKYDPQTKISRRHARIWRDGNNFLVEDLGSSNGTTLIPAISDSIRLLPHQPHNLVSGDKIRLGDTTLHFTVG